MRNDCLVKMRTGHLIIVVYCLISICGAFAFDGNEFADLAIGVPYEDFAGFQNAGIVNLLYSTSSGPGVENNLYFSQDSSGIEDQCELEDRFGNDMASGDFNGDGFADLAVGIKWEDVGGEADAGAVAVIYGSSGGLSATTIPDQFLTLNDLDVAAVSQTYDLFGDSLAAGDFNADGFDDLVVGNPDQNVGIYGGAGIVYVINGSAQGLDPQDVSEWSQESEEIEGASEADDNFGKDVAAGDVNGDGYDDLVVGTYGEAIGSVARAGCIHVIYGSAGGLTATGNQIIWQGYESEYEGAPEEYDRLGYSLASADFNGDGFADIAAGAPFESTEGSATIPYTGCVMVMYGSGNGIVPDGNTIFSRSTPGNSDLFAKSLAAGDINGDGYDDLAVGSPGAQINGLANSGLFVLYYGSGAGLVLIGSETHYQGDGVISDTAEAFDVFGETLACGDLNGDGFDDLAIGAPWEDIETPSVIMTTGAVHTVYGSASGLTGAGERFWTQDTDGVEGGAEAEDQFGSSLAISAAPKASCTETGVALWMPAHSFAPGQTCGCRATVCNAGATPLANHPLFVILDVAGTYFFAPSFSAYDNYLTAHGSFPPGRTEVIVLPNFSWPAGAGSFSGCMFYGALTNPAVTTLVGEMDSWFFSWTE